MIQLRNLDMKQLINAGILHTKLWVIDSKHFYVGSANMDWRALTQVSNKRCYSGLASEALSCGNLTVATDSVSNRVLVYIV